MNFSSIAFRGLLILILIFILIFSGLIFTDHQSRKNKLLYLFDSELSAIQFNLYFGMIGLFSLFIYTGYATLINQIIFDPASLGEGISVLFIGIGIGCVGQGLQNKEDGPIRRSNSESIKPTASNVVVSSMIEGNFISRLSDGNDRTLEMHLFLGVVSIIVLILFQGYDLVYVDTKFFSPQAYGTGLAYIFAGIGAASWGQGFQRKYQYKKAKTITEIDDN